MKAFLIIIIVFIAVVASCKKSPTEENLPKGCVDEYPPGREYYYWYQDQKFLLSLDRNLLSVGFVDSATHDHIGELIGRYNLIIQRIREPDHPEMKQYVLLIPKGKGVEEFFTHYACKDSFGFGDEPLVKYSLPVFFPQGSDSTRKLYVTDEFIVNFDPSVLDYIKTLVCQHNVETISGDLFRVTKKSDMNTIDMVNFFHDQPGVRFAEPNFWWVPVYP